MSRRRRLWLIALAGPLAAAALASPEAARLEVEHDRVTAGDLAALWPAWRELAPETPVLLAPAPGVTREMWRTELDHLAVRHGLTVPASGGPERVRIERRMRLLEEAEARAALAAALAERYRAAPDDISVELIGFEAPLVPAGELRFRSAGCLPPAGEAAAVPLSWATPERRSATIWLRARIEVRGRYAVAARPLEPRQPIAEGDLVWEEGPLPRPPERWRLDPAEVSGRMLTRPVAGGERIARAWLAVRPAVERGATVELELRASGVHLRTQGRAEQSGAVGQRRVFRNLATGRRVTARVVSPGKAEVIP